MLEWKGPGITEGEKGWMGMHIAATVHGNLTLCSPNEIHYVFIRESTLFEGRTVVLTQSGLPEHGSQLKSSLRASQQQNLRAASTHHHL